MPAPATATLADPLPAYRGVAGRYDEYRAADGTVRPAWADFFRLLGAGPLKRLRLASEASARAVIEQDISMNVYAGARSESQPWPVDAVPHLVGAEDWQKLSAGLCQRAQLYNELLRDIYGPQNILRSGVLPPELVLANPNFLRPCVTPGMPRGVFLHSYAVDLARGPDGRWWVLQDRLDAPSGIGYSLQNRILSRTALAPVFHRAPVQRLREFFRGFRASLADLAPSGARGGKEPRVVLLTPGPANETHFEQAYLARYLGYPLVEGADLTSRDRQVFLRTVSGLKKVDVIVRRVDSGFCDPLELQAHSWLGVPGLVNAAQYSGVAIANSLGGAALESNAMLAFLEPLCREILGCGLQLPSAPTWWAGQESAKKYILSQLSSLLVKPTYRGGEATRYGPLLDETQRAAIAAAIEARPASYCGQERILLGTTPAWRDGTIEPVPYIMRMFVSWQDGAYRAMPGGLTRFNPSGEDAVVSLQQGSATKDTWVFGAKVEEKLPSSAPLAESPRFSATPSRVADNLFWLGRYLERTSQLARLLDKIDPLLRDEIAALDPTVAADAFRILLKSQATAVPKGADSDDIAAVIRVRADDPAQPGSLAANLGHVIRNLDQVKVRLPPEAWRILRRLRAIADTGHPQLALDLGEQLASLETLATETLAHDLSWRFLKLGRRIERSSQLVFVARELLVPQELREEKKKDEAATPKTRTAGAAEPREFRLQTLLHFTESLFAYRSIYHGLYQHDSVLAWLLGAAENPRGLRFQAERILEHLAVLPSELAPRPVATLRARSLKLAMQVRLIDAPALAADPRLLTEFLGEAGAALAEINDLMTQIYFSHSEVPDVADIA